MIKNGTETVVPFPQESNIKYIREAYTDPPPQYFDFTNPAIPNSSPENSRIQLKAVRGFPFFKNTDCGTPYVPCCTTDKTKNSERTFLCPPLVETEEWYEDWNYYSFLSSLNIFSPFINNNTNSDDNYGLGPFLRLSGGAFYQATVKYNPQDGSEQKTRVTVSQEPSAGNHQSYPSFTNPKDYFFTTKIPPGAQTGTNVNNLSTLILFNSPGDGNFPLKGWKARILDSNNKLYQNFNKVIVDLQLCPDICPNINSNNCDLGDCPEVATSPHPSPDPSPDPSPHPSPHTSPKKKGLSTGLIVGIVSGILVILLITILFVKG
jgi:hypothetical protein